MHIFSRKSFRKEGKDYTDPGYYFVTLCTKDRICCFGEIRQGKMHLSEYGKTAEECLREIPYHYPLADLDTYIVMPDHVHFILHIVANDIPEGAHGFVATKLS